MSTSAKSGQISRADSDTIQPISPRDRTPRTHQRGPLPKLRSFPGSVLFLIELLEPDVLTTERPSDLSRFPSGPSVALGNPTSHQRGYGAPPSAPTGGAPFDNHSKTSRGRSDCLQW
jgi:hypothetical protein